MKYVISMALHALMMQLIGQIEGSSTAPKEKWHKKLLFEPEDNVNLGRSTASKEKWHEDISFEPKDNVNLNFIPKKTNIAIVVDVGKRYHACSRTLLQYIVDGISLAVYRISLYTTSGIYVDIMEFQSRECLLQKIKNYRKRSETINEVLDDVAVDYRRFSVDNQLLLILADRTMGKNVTAKIRSLVDGNGERAYIVNVKHAQYMLDRGASNERAFANILRKLNFVNIRLHSCNDGRSVADECGRKCDCINGKKVNCYRFRKEFSSMPLNERLRYISTYKELFNNKIYRSDFIDYINYHPDYFWKGIHKGVEFYPWHRKYLLGFENMLRLVNCKVTVPYWNWALHSDIAWSATPSYHMWNDVGGFGGNGIAEKAYCVGTGYFSYHAWNPGDNRLSRRKVLTAACNIRDLCKDDDEECEDKYEKDSEKVTPEQKNCMNIAHSHSKYKRCLRRRFSRKPPTYQMVYETIAKNGVNEFKDIDNEMRENWHNDIHNKVGGHMETPYSSYAPEFWLHHGVLDAFWDKWQKKGKEYEDLDFLGNLTVLLGFVPEENPKFYVNNDNLAGCGIKIRYQNVLPFKPIERNKENDQLNVVEALGNGDPVPP